MANDSYHGTPVVVGSTRTDEGIELVGLNLLVSLREGRVGVVALHLPQAVVDALVEREISDRLADLAPSS